MKILIVMALVALSVLNALEIPYNDPDEVQRHDMGYVIYSAVICKKNYALAVVVTGDGVAIQQLMAKGNHHLSPPQPIRCK